MLVVAAGGGAYYAAKRSINADKQARHEEDMKRRQLAQSRASNTPEPTPKARRRKADHAGSPSTEASHDPAPIHHTADNGNAKAQEQNWLLKNTATSPAKTSAVGKFLVALASSFSTSDATGDHGHANKPKPSSRRQKLHILYLVHDLLHHAKFHATNFADSDSPNQGLRPYISQLVSVASAYDAEKYPRHFIKINELLSLWNKGKYFPASYLATLKEASTSTSKATTWSTGNVDDGEGSNARIEPTEIRKDAPYIMPPSHGDASDPYYDLPAGNLMSHIVPNSTTPIVPRAVKPLQFRAGPANEKLANIVKAFLQEADAVYGGKLPGNGVLGTDIDQLGQSITFNGPRGEPLIGEGYYGWSREFCERMKSRNKRGRNQTSIHSQNETRQTRQQRDYSDSDFRRSRSRSSTRSLSPPRHRGRRSTPPAFDDSRSHSRSRSPPRPYQRDQRTRDEAYARPGPSRSRSPSRSYSPPDMGASQRHAVGSGTSSVSWLPHNGSLSATQSPPILPPQGFLGPGQFPIPPPRPLNYTGPWPPPPPPLPAQPPGLSSHELQIAPQLPFPTNSPAFIPHPHLHPPPPPPPPPPSNGFLYR
ncbi:MAG: hypothetical protein Q9194_005517 [Teloschistes cf. exilis]